MDSMDMMDMMVIWLDSTMDMTVSKLQDIVKDRKPGVLQFMGCQRIAAFELVVLEKTLESPLDCKEIEPVHPRGNQSWVFIGKGLTLKLKLIFWPPHVKS